MWTLGKRSGENALNVVAKEYEGQVLIHIRHYYKATGEDRWYPTKKGITLNLEEWDKFTVSIWRELWVIVCIMVLYVERVVVV